MILKEKSHVSIMILTWDFSYQWSADAPPALKSISASFLADNLYKLHYKANGHHSVNSIDVLTLRSKYEVNFKDYVGETCVNINISTARWELRLKNWYSPHGITDILLVSKRPEKIQMKKTHKTNCFKKYKKYIGKKINGFLCDFLGFL